MGDYECKVEWGGEPAPVKTVNLKISPVSADKSENFPTFFFIASSSLQRSTFLKKLLVACLVLKVKVL